jgi:hypothetical protein
MEVLQFSSKANFVQTFCFCLRNGFLKVLQSVLSKGSKKKLTVFHQEKGNIEAEKFSIKNFWMLLQKEWRPSNSKCATSSGSLCTTRVAGAAILRLSL